MVLKSYYSTWDLQFVSLARSLPSMLIIIVHDGFNLYSTRTWKAWLWMCRMIGTGPTDSVFIEVR